MSFLMGAELDGLWLGRIWQPKVGPVMVTIRDAEVFDITSADAATVRDVLELDDAADYNP